MIIVIIIIARFGLPQPIKVGSYKVLTTRLEEDDDDDDQRSKREERSTFSLTLCH